MQGETGGCNGCCGVVGNVKDKGRIEHDGQRKNRDKIKTAWLGRANQREGVSSTGNVFSRLVVGDEVPIPAVDFTSDPALHERSSVGV